MVGSRIMMSCRWRLLGHNEWGLWLQGQSEGAIVVGMGIFCFNFFIWVLFGFEVWIMWCLMVRIVWVWKWWVGSDGWCRGGRRLLGHTMLANGSWFCFEFFFFFFDLVELIYVWLPCVILDLIGLILVWWREDFCFWNVM